MLSYQPLHPLIVRREESRKELSQGREVAERAGGVRAGGQKRWGTGEDAPGWGAPEA